MMVNTRQVMFRRMTSNGFGYGRRAASGCVVRERGLFSARANILCMSISVTDFGQFLRSPAWLSPRMRK